MLVTTRIVNPSVPSDAKIEAVYSDVSVKDFYEVHYVGIYDGCNEELLRQSSKLPLCDDYNSAFEAACDILKSELKNMHIIAVITPKHGYLANVLRKLHKK
jgi:hypothetical protein